MRYIPYPVVNLIYDRPVFNRGYDTWCPGNTFTDFIVADWVVRNQPGYKQKYNILTCYTPLRREQRAQLLTDEGCKQLAGKVLHDFQKLTPETNAEPIEVHIYRRGHPLYQSLPGHPRRYCTHTATNERYVRTPGFGKGTEQQRPRHYCRVAGGQGVRGDAGESGEGRGCDLREGLIKSMDGPSAAKAAFILRPLWTA